MMEECFWKEADHNAGRGMNDTVHKYGGMGIAIAVVPVGQGGDAGTNERNQPRM